MINKSRFIALALAMVFLGACNAFSPEPAPAKPQKLSSWEIQHQVNAKRVQERAALKAEREKMAGVDEASSPVN